MLFRFLEYDYLNEDDMYTNAKYIAGIDVPETYDRFFKTLQNAEDYNVEIGDGVYTINEIQFHYDGGKDDLFCCNVYCTGY